MKKRILSLLMAMILCASLAVLAFATEGEMSEMSDAEQSDGDYTGVSDPDVYLLGDGSSTRMAPALFWNQRVIGNSTETYLGKEVTVWSFPADTAVGMDDWSYLWNIYKSADDGTTETDVSYLFESGLPFVLPEAGTIYRFEIKGFDSVVCKEYYVRVGGTTEAPAAPAVEIKMNLGNLVGYVNGTATTLDAAPVIKNDRTMLPVRFVSENLGAEVGWDGATSTVTLTNENTTIEIVIGADTARVNGVDTPLDSPAYIDAANNRTYLPVRFVAENLGAKVNWDASTQTVTLTK